MNELGLMGLLGGGMGGYGMDQMGVQNAMPMSLGSMNQMGMAPAMGGMIPQAGMGGQMGMFGGMGAPMGVGGSLIQMYMAKQEQKKREELMKMWMDHQLKMQNTRLKALQQRRQLAPM